MPYIDNSKDIAALFEKKVPDFVAKNDHVAGISFVNTITYITSKLRQVSSNLIIQFILISQKLKI